MNKNKEHPLVGMYCHTFVEGKLNYQGRIIGLLENYILVQTYEWLMGGEDEIVGIPLEDIMDIKKVRIYPDAELMEHKSRKYIKD